jgi:hypothetical protein
MLFQVRAGVQDVLVLLQTVVRFLQSASLMKKLMDLKIIR